MGVSYKYICAGVYCTYALRTSNRHIYVILHIYIYIVTSLSSSSFQTWCNGTFRSPDPERFQSYGIPYQIYLCTSADDGDDGLILCILSYATKTLTRYIYIKSIPGKFFFFFFFFFATETRS